MFSWIKHYRVEVRALPSALLVLHMLYVDWPLHVRATLVENREATNLSVEREQQALCFCLFLGDATDVESFGSPSIQQPRV